jgi:hypothetical protein
MINNEKMIFDAWRNGKRRQYIVSGVVANTLILLVRFGVSGIAYQDTSNKFSDISAHIHKLRTEYGLDVEEYQEESEGSYQIRYVLHTPVEMLGTYWL